MKRITTVAFVIFLLSLAGPAFAVRPDLPHTLPVIDSNNEDEARPTGMMGWRRDDAARPTGMMGWRGGGNWASGEQRQGQTRASRAQGMIGMFRQRLDRYQDFLAKTESRRNKLKDQGANVADLDAFIAKARTNIKSTKEAIDAAETSLSSIDFSRFTRTMMTEFQTPLKNVRLSFTALHKTMSETVKEIRRKSVRQ